MNEIEARVYFVNLLNIYGSLLSKTQKEVLDDYLNFDLSLAEIAENRNISRSAVEDAIKKGKKKLVEIEDKINLLQKNHNLLEITAKIKEISNDKDIDNLINELERSIKNGI